MSPPGRPQAGDIVVTTGGHQIVFKPTDAIRIGRDADGAVVLADERVSRHHGQLRHQHDGWHYVDAGSSNGTFDESGRRVQYAAIGRSRALRLGDSTTGPTVVFDPINAARPAPPLVLFAGLAVGVSVLAAVLLGTQSTSPPAVTPSGETSSASASPTRTAPLGRVAVAELGRVSTVRVTQPSGHGSGVYLGGDRVLTAAHVIGSAGVIRISFDDRDVGTASVVKVDAERDLALLAISGLDERGAKPAVWGDSNSLRPGDDLIALGYPIDLPLTVKFGIVSGVRRETLLDFVQTDASLNPGMSGGPLFDQHGRLVGITDFGHPRYPGLNFGIASSTARQFAEGR